VRDREREREREKERERERETERDRDRERENGDKTFALEKIEACRSRIFRVSFFTAAHDLSSRPTA
jgi:hypothetical protein